MICGNACLWLARDVKWRTKRQSFQPVTRTYTYTRASEQWVDGCSCSSMKTQSKCQLVIRILLSLLNTLWMDLCCFCHCFLFLLFLLFFMRTCFCFMSWILFVGNLHSNYTRTCAQHIQLCACIRSISRIYVYVCTLVCVCVCRAVKSSLSTKETFH